MPPYFSSRVPAAAEPTEPCYIKAQGTLPSSTQIQTKTSSFSSYSPGAMLAESAFMAANFGVEASFNAAKAFRSSSDFTDPGTESDCSTADTANEALHLAASDGFMLPSLGMLPDASWQFSGGSYFSPYPTIPEPEPVEPLAWPTAASDPEMMAWSQQLPTVGSAAHALGRCKPCAFMYKDGCQSGINCQYCHLCPPGEKQRRKRVMRSMQRNMAN